jgi:paraquat-inducible protein A
VVRKRVNRASRRRLRHFGKVTALLPARKLRAAVSRRARGDFRMGGMRHPAHIIRFAPPPDFCGVHRMPDSSAATGRFVPRLIPVFIAGASLLFGFGVFFPFFHVTKLWVFDDAISVVSGIMTLFEEGEYFLFVVLSLFTLVFPMGKLALLAMIWAERKHALERVRRFHRWVDQLGKWSMLDVFVVAVLIVAMKSSSVANLEIGIGLYLFTASVIATQFISGWLHRTLAAADES